MIMIIAQKIIIIMIFDTLASAGLRYPNSYATGSCSWMEFHVLLGRGVGVNEPFFPRNPTHTSEVTMVT